MAAKKTPTLSLCMMVKNEEKLLRGCLKRMRPVVDEIVIIDAGSKDDTVKIARSFGAKVFSRNKWKDDYLSIRNEYIKMASGDWVLALDADEKIAGKDLGKLKDLLLNEKVSGYILPVRNYIDSSNVLHEWRPCRGEYPNEEICSGWFPSESIRLFRNKKDFYYDGCLLLPDIKESIVKSGGRIERSPIPIHHHSYKKYHTYNKIRKKQLRYLKISLKSLKVFPKNAYMHFNVGNILFLYKKDLKRSVLYLERAVKLSPDFAPGYWSLSLVYQKQKRYDRAEKILKTALKADPGRRYLTHSLLGHLYLKQENLAMAAAHLKKARDLKIA